MIEDHALENGNSVGDDDVRREQRRERHGGREFGAKRSTTTKEEASKGTKEYFEGEIGETRSCCQDERRDEKVCRNVRKGECNESRERQMEERWRDNEGR